jgi:hypothetical protein
LGASQCTVIICGAAILVITISSANAGIAATGPGTQTCGEFAKSYQLSPRAAEDHYFAWAQGFMGGLNAAAIGRNDGTNRDLSSISFEQQQQHLRAYCNDHPLATYMKGVLELYMKFAISSGRE